MIPNQDKNMTMPKYLYNRTKTTTNIASIVERSLAEISNSPTEVLCDNRPLSSSTLEHGKMEELNQESDELPTAIKIILRITGPLLAGVLAIIIGFMLDSSISFIFYFLAILAFTWYAVQLAWVEREPSQD